MSRLLWSLLADYLNLDISVTTTLYYTVFICAYCRTVVTCCLCFGAGINTQKAAFGLRSPTSPSLFSHGMIFVHPGYIFFQCVCRSYSRMSALYILTFALLADACDWNSSI